MLRLTVTRTDIGKRLEKALPELHAMGYSMDLEYACEED